VAIRKPKPLDEDALFNYALRALGGRAHSQGELREKLRRRAADTGALEAVLGRLKEAGYLDDRRFAEGFAAARLENQGLGSARVLRDLRQRRVAPALAGEAVEKTFAGVDEVRLIEDFLARKFRGKQLPAFLADEKNLAGAYRRLRYAGFSSNASIQVLKKYAREAEELEGLEMEEESGGA
jgi:regulatory protein